MCRGKFRSKPWTSLLDEARHLVASGVVELNLIAEDTNQYGQDRCALWYNLSNQCLLGWGEVDGLQSGST
jgi:ribosomal protein S12 methylthiotransferase